MLRVIRGLPGAGKSTLAASLAALDPRVRVFEADQHFVQPDGSYVFDRRQLGTAHAACLLRTEAWLAESLDHSAIVANTFTTRAEYAPYVQAALAHGHVCQVIEVHGPWASIHNVPLSTYAHMRDRWEPTYAPAR